MCIGICGKANFIYSIYSLIIEKNNKNLSLGFISLCNNYNYLTLFIQVGRYLEVVFLKENRTCLSRMQ